MRKKFLLAVAAIFAIGGAALYTPDKPLAELKARWGGPPSKFVEVDGLAIHYRDEGTGPALLLLHGSGSSIHTWQAWADALSKDHRVVRLDLPSCGLTGPFPDDDYRIPHMEQLVDDFTRKVGLDHFAMAGNSWGGEIAWSYTLDHRDRVSALVLVDSAGFPLNHPLPLAFRLAQVPGLSALLGKLGTRFFVEKTTRKVYGDPTRIPPEVLARYQDLTRREGNRRAFTLRMQAPHVDRTGELGKLGLPTLILWGSEDRLIPVAYAEKFHAAIPGSRVKIYPGIGHTPMEEAGAATAADADAFLANR
jgi:pimeloyl-ACP methyl ester carboxylesterase